MKSLPTGKRSVLVISFSHLSRDPRVRSTINALREKYDVTAIGLDDPMIGGVVFLKCRSGGRTCIDKLRSGFDLALGNFEKYYWNSPRVAECITILNKVSFDVVIANDVDTLPLALNVRGSSAVIYDAHEFSARQFEDKWKWRTFYMPYYHYLCAHYLTEVDYMLTVSPGIAEEYWRTYGIRPDVICNFPRYYDLDPTPPNPGEIRMVHHGAASSSRKIENMISLMDLLDNRFTLDLLLLGGSKAYMNKLWNRARNNARIRFRDPVSVDGLPFVLNKYDIGLYLLPPHSVNAKFALPNKLFEFIQARLCTVIGPSPEMSRIVREHRCGLVSADFELSSLAMMLNSLTVNDIVGYKQNASIAAESLNARQNQGKMRAIVEDLI